MPNFLYGATRSSAEFMRSAVTVLCMNPNGRHPTGATRRIGIGLEVAATVGWRPLRSGSPDDCQSRGRGFKSPRGNGRRPTVICWVSALRLGWIL